MAKEKKKKKDIVVLDKADIEGRKKHYKKQCLILKKHMVKDL